MRTLKKTLCLVLCLAMMAGLCVFASADFKDQGKIENEEAVAVLTGIGVIQGDDKGNFNPEGTLTRAEATVIITKLLGAADIKATTDKFTDVKADYWGMPYIAYCVAEGVVAGMGDGTFAPNAKLTGYQWATLLLRAIGYKIEGESWQIDVAKLVKSLGLAEGMTFNGVNEITRQDACQMALNALFTPFTALVFLIFTLLYTPCVAAIAAVKRELGGGRAALGVVLMQCGIAWVVAFAVHCAGVLLGLA